MELSKWQSVLVEWVNCLNISKPITKIVELKNGEFFGKLLAEFAQSQDLESCSNVCDTYITDFLKKHYPAYGIDNEPSHSQDSVEITYVCSLLLHYCCIKDCRPEFISPLCENLSLTIQVFMKTFLEDLQSGNDITRDVLKDAISSIHKLSSTPTKPYCNSPYNSPKLSTPNANPLVEFFRTPLKKYQLNYELQKKEVKTLLAQLDLERFEKADLQEELKFQYEKNKKLDKKIADKHSEISRLRSELLSLESRTPPSCSKTEGRLENKRLRDEITSLEKYVQILHKEQEELQTERDAARDRLQRIEEQCNEWQNKALHIERYCSKLTEDKEHQQEELTLLHERCEELTAMLSELKPKPMYDESYEMDSSQMDYSHNKSGLIDNESLAHTVVDMQLLDAQEENKTLRRQLTDLELNSTDLTNQIHSLKCRLNILVQENDVLQESNDVLNEKVLLLEQTEKQLTNTQNELIKCSTELAQHIATGNNLNKDIAELNTKLAATETSLSVSRQDNEQLLIELKSTIDMNNNLHEELNTQNIKYTELQSANENMQLQLHETIQQTLKYESENGMLQLTLDRFNNDLKNCLVKLQDQLKKSKDIDTNGEDGILRLEKLITDLEIKNNTDANDMSQLRDNCEDLKTKIVQFEGEISKLNKVEIASRNEIDTLKTCLSDCENKIAHFETVIVVNYDKSIAEYKSVIDDKCQVISELIKLKDAITEKDKHITTLEGEKMQLNENINKLNEIESNLSEKLAVIEQEKLHLTETLHNLEEEATNEKKFIDKLQNDLENMKSVLKERGTFINNLDKEKLSLDKTVNTLQNDISKEKRLTNDLENANKTLKENIVEKEGLIKDLEREKVDLQENLTNLESKLLNETQQNVQLNDCNVKLQLSMNEKDERIKNIDNEKMNINKQMEIVNCELEHTKQEKVKLENICQELTETIAAKEDRINNLNIEKSAVHQQAQCLKQEIEDISKLKEELEIMCVDLKEVALERENHVQELTEKKLDLNNQIDTLNERVNNLQREISSEKSLKEELQKSLIKMREDHDCDTKILISKMDKQNVHIEKLQAQIQSLNETIFSINEEIVSIEHSIRTEQMQQDSLRKSENVIQDLQSNVSVLKEHLATATAVKNEAIEELTAHNEELTMIKKQYEEYRHEMELNIEELNVNLTMQLELKSACTRGNEIISNDQELKALKNLEQMHCEELMQEKECLKKMSNKMQNLKEHITELIQEKNCVDSEIDTLKKQVSILENVKVDVEMNFRSLECDSASKIAVLNKLYETLQLEHDTCLNELEFYRKQLDSSQNALTETQASLEELIGDHKVDIAKYQSNINQLQTTNTSLESDFNELQVKQTQLAAELVAVKQELEVTIDKYTASLSHQEEIKHHNAIEIAKLNKQLAESIKSFTDLEKNHSETITKLEQSLTEIETEKCLRADLECTVSTIQSDSSDLRNQLDLQINALKIERDSLKADMEKLYQELAGLKQINNELDEKIHITEIEKEKLSLQLTENDAKYQTKFDEYAAKKLEWQNEMSNLKEKLMNIEKERQELDRIYKEYICASDKKLSEVKLQHKCALEKCQSEIENLTSLLKEAQDNLVQLEKTKEHLSTEHTMDISEKQTHLEKLQMNNNQLKENIKILSEDKNILATKLDEVTDDLLKLQSHGMENDRKYEAKLNEIEFVKKKMQVILTAIADANKTLENELDRTIVNSSLAEETLDKTKEKFVDEIDCKEILATRVQNEIHNLNKQITNIVSVKNKMEVELETIREKMTVLGNKNEQDTRNYEIKLQELEEERVMKLNNMESHKLEIIRTLEKKLILKDNDIEAKITEISTINTKLMETIELVQTLELEKSRILTKLEMIKSELRHLKLNRDELETDTRTAVKELEQNIWHGHESLQKLKAEFINRLKMAEKEKSNEIELKKQLENFLTAEKQKVEFLEQRLQDISSEKEDLISLCSTCNNHVHDLYEITVEIENDNITEKHNRLKEHEANLQDKLKLLYSEKEIVDAECEEILKEIKNLKKTCSELSNYELIKSDYATLKEKYNLLTTCESENNSLKTKMSELELKLSDLQLENIKYQKILSDKELNKEHTLKEHNNLKDRYEEELSLMKATCANWQSIINDNETEYKKLQSEKQVLKEKNKELLIVEKDYENLKVAHGISENKILELEQTLLNAENRLKKTVDEHDVWKQNYNELLDKTPLLEIEIANLQQNIEQYKKLITEIETEHESLTKNYRDLSDQHKFITEKCTREHDKGEKQELVKLRTAYTNLMADNSRLQLDCTVLKKTLEDRNAQLSEMSLIKEAYEKLLEDNNKVNMEVDTLRYKRTRDKEEFKRLIEEERSKGNSNVDGQIQEVRNEYEEKLRKMKDKIVKLYKEEVDKERRKVASKQQEQVQQEETIAALKSQLWVTGNKYVDMKRENEKLTEQLRALKQNLHYESLDDLRGSRESVNSLRERRPIRDVEERRMSTLPRDARLTTTSARLVTSAMVQPVDIIEESVTFSRRRSVNVEPTANLDRGLIMEDEEGEVFNNTYLSDLKAGRCTVPSQMSTGRESVYSNRLSELQSRNSMCLPHLKSSYPAETQFSSPGQFKEEDIKMGGVDLDDSMSSSLLPGEKPRTKKDWGQTLYKKPGPPTPSKNGGRLSLQGNEIHPRDVLREQNDNVRSQDRVRTISTPGRIKALFTRSSTSTSTSSSQRNNDSENHTTPSRNKRRSIFRR
ncbi:mushroom body defect [Carabus blaptoides fortunei]